MTPKKPPQIKNRPRKKQTPTTERFGEVLRGRIISVWDEGHTPFNCAKSKGTRLVKLRITEIRRYKLRTMIAQPAPTRERRGG